MSDKKQNEGGFMKFLYNSDTGEVLGRTGMSWAKIIVFYIIFYACLATFFGLLLYGFYTTLDQERPKYELDESVIGSNPGVGFRPQPDQDKNVDSTLIWFKPSDKKDYEFWTDQLDKYLKETSIAKGLKGCGFNQNKTTDSNGCNIDFKYVAPACRYNQNNTNTYGYEKGSPCVLFKLNRIYGWKPKPYNYKDSTGNFDANIYKQSLKDAQVPEDLIKKIDESLNHKDNKDVKAQTEIAGSVWIWCNGENPADRENMGKLNYGTFPGIPSYYFPFKKQKNYISPFLIVQFENPNRGVLVNIECKAYAANIFPDRTTRTGSVHFELMVEN